MILGLLASTATMAKSTEINGKMSLDTTLVGKGYSFSVKKDSLNQKHYYISIRQNYRIGAVGLFEQETKHSFIKRYQVTFEFKDKKEVTFSDSNLRCKMYTTDLISYEYNIGARPKYASFVFTREVDRSFIESCSKGEVKSCNANFSIVEMYILDFEMINPLFLSMLDKDLERSNAKNKETHILLMYTYFHVNYIKKDTALKQIDTVAFKNKIRQYITFKKGELSMSQMNFGKATVKNGTSDLRLKDKRKNFMLKSSDILLLK